MICKLYGNPSVALWWIVRLAALSINLASNFHTIIPYLDLLTHSGLVVRTEGEIPVYRTTEKGKVALGHLREVERLVWAGTDEEKLIS